MVVTLLLIALLGTIFAYFVIQPLLASEQDTVLTDALESEVEFQELLALRDALLERLTKGEESVVSGSHPRTAALTDAQAMTALARTCLVLKRLGLPYLPLILAGLALAWGLRPQAAWAYPSDPSASPATSSTSESGEDSAPRETTPRMPGLLSAPDGTALSQIHQFVLSPDQGQMRVYYLAMFRSESPETQSVKLRIPSPDGARDFDFSNMTQATLDPGRALEPPVLSLPVQSGINQVQGMFTVPAFSGTLEWNSSFLKTLPGVVLIILPQYHDFLSVIFGDALNSLGNWPPRFKVETTQGFDLRLSAEQPNERDPNYARLKNPPQQFSYHLFRRGSSDEKYPEFKVTGLAPSRLPGALLIVTFGLLIAAVLVARASFSKSK